MYLRSVVETSCRRSQGRLVSSPAVLRHAKVLWDYHRIGASLPESVDFILALGCSDLRVAERAAELVLEGRAELLATTGGFGKISKTLWNEPEAQRFAQVARDCGVPDAKILTEDSASDTGQNITNTRRLVRELGLHLTSGLLVSKPYMERRSLATAECQWPEVDWSVTSPRIAFEDYPTAESPLTEMVELMVGDLQRIKLYAARGFQVPQDVPAHVWDAYEALVEAGYNRYVIDEATTWPAPEASDGDAGVLEGAAG